MTNSGQCWLNRSKRGAYFKQVSSQVLDKLQSGKESPGFSLYLLGFALFYSVCELENYEITLCIARFNDL